MLSRGQGLKSCCHGAGCPQGIPFSGLVPLMPSGKGQRAEASAKEEVRKLLIPWQAKTQPQPSHGWHPAMVHSLLPLLVLPWDLTPSTTPQNPVDTLVLA